MRAKVKMPTAAEDRRINRGIAQDPDTFEVTTEHMARAKSASDTIPPHLYARLTSPRRRGPGKRPAKVPVTIKVEPSLLDALRASGAGWQVRAAEALRRLVDGSA